MGERLPARDSSAVLEVIVLDTLRDAYIGSVLQVP